MIKLSSVYNYKHPHVVEISILTSHPLTQGLERRMSRKVKESFEMQISWPGMTEEFTNSQHLCLLAQDWHNKMKPVKISTPMQSGPWGSTVGGGALDDCRGKGCHPPLVSWPLVACPYPRGWLHTHVHMSSTNWIQGEDVKLEGRWDVGRRGGRWIW